MTSFTDLLDQYLADRRRYGGDLASSALVLRPFVTFADAEGDEWITTDLFLRWKDRFGAAGTVTWAIRLSVVRGFAAWLQGIDPRTEVPPRGLIPNRQRRQRPCIHTDSEIARIVIEAARLPSRRGLRGLRGYRAERNRIPGAASTAFFVGENGQRLNIGIAGHAFARVGQNIGLRERQTGRGRGPRLHDLRHTMASVTILDWFRSGRDPDREMYKLSTWLGHTDPAETYWYIEAVPELLRLASERAERSFGDGEGS